MSRTEQSTPFLSIEAPITNVVVVDRSAQIDASEPAVSRVEMLVKRMRQGDRHAAAEFLAEYGTRLRRRIRGKLGASMRRLFDSLDIMSTVGRRLDLYVMSGRLTASNEMQLWSLMFQMADHAVIDKARLFRRLENSEGEDSGFARDMVQRLHKAELEECDGVEIEIERCLKSIADPVDRQILSLWLTGESLASMGTALNLTPVAVRKRWESLKFDLRQRLSQG